ncbi:MAG: 50S ribosomal protein L19 [Candidatus Yanofskybacteria bacterium RIFCSPLOWO2_01_FULL_41_34]|uniref:50S ribosomal protein L19 n=1 Tax=Candidatus Yanofskybacteria bacterium RIFCSPHIGHO2_01_FULL_41_26 TaxID=1802661 RepID=A0A1F8EC21_9BACT|nr:MAG: 50S ribosomal protein L19 [Candidatus Yanofskybacteria bacterium RIFCSPHIGHO2_01_FULL_41_26]OGN21610.1 MAG: 50S ribosomal protein L19 [Candidatus Yanofskybacteria bacterium RIFCSPLOWO2_01_FULL_41_34]
MDKIQLFQSKNLRQNKFEGLKSGWTVKVYQKIKESEKTRTQAFEGIIIARKHGAQAGGTVTVRKVSGGIGVEKTFPVFLPTIAKVEVIRKSKVRRSKLYYLRDKTAKEIRRKTKIDTSVQTEKLEKTE